jgi:putative ABC transport system ATP-binding protein
VLDLFEELNADGKTIIMITHEDEVASRAKRVIRLRDGLVESDVRQD